jgi:amino acid permease
MAEDGNPFAIERRKELDCGLPRASSAAIGISSTTGIGLFITSSQLIAIAGSLGTFLACIIASVITACVMVTMREPDLEVTTHSPTQAVYFYGYNAS